MIDFLVYILSISVISVIVFYIFKLLEKSEKSPKLYITYEYQCFQISKNLQDIKGQLIAILNNYGSNGWDFVTIIEDYIILKREILH